MAKQKTPGTAGPGDLEQTADPAWFMPEQLERRPISELVPYARNARTHSDAQIAQIRASIREFGFINPVLIDSAGNIIAGHGRVLAAQAEGMTEVPCVLVEHLSDAQRRAYILADNRLAEMSGWDLDMVAIELGDIRDAGLDLTLTGFTEADLELEQEPEYDFSDFDEENAKMEGLEEVTISVIVPKKHKEQVETYLANGESNTGPGRGIGVLKRCGLR